MGIDNAHIFNHNLRYTTAGELTELLSQRTGFPVFNDIYDSEGNNTLAVPPDFYGLTIHTDNSLTLQDYLDKQMLLEFSLRTTEHWTEIFSINKYVTDDLPGVYLGRWRDTVEMCRVIKKYGLRTFEEYDKENIVYDEGAGGGAYTLQWRQQVPSVIKKFGSTQMLTFCSDYHDVYIEHLQENWTFNDLINWGKKEFIFVEFKDLVHFDFPEKRAGSL